MVITKFKAGAFDHSDINHRVCVEPGALWRSDIDVPAAFPVFGRFSTFDLNPPARRIGPVFVVGNTMGDMLLGLCLLLIFAAVPVLVGWVEVSKIVASTTHIAPPIVHINGNRRRVWVLKDLKERASGGDMSYRFLNEYDCTEGRRRTLSITSYSDHMGNGNVLYSSVSGLGEWNNISPDTAGEHTLKAVCAK